MSIKYAILGVLSWKKTTGYELKKIFEESSAMYWSGNNNQIYKALVQLLDEGLVTNQVQHQDSAPNKKIYTITENGRNELKKWIQSTPEPPEIKKTFLVQLSWADILDEKEILEMLSNYEKEIKLQLIIQEEKKRRNIVSPGRSNREILLWDMISENLIFSYKNEIKWINTVRQQLLNVGSNEEGNKMNHKIIERGIKKYIELLPADIKISKEEQALDLISIGWENDIHLIMLHGEALHEDFFNLKTGLAGTVLQKFINYNIKVAVILPSQTGQNDRFREMVLEANKGTAFRVFTTRNEAENWLTGQ